MTVGLGYELSKLVLGVAAGFVSMREVVRKSRPRTLVAKDLPGTGSGKEGSGMSSADEPAHLVALAGCWG